ncbi:hypothetical protein [Haloquadratum walsbyi]|jgi:hypothetical protein|uniref:Uncharacterized protein n=1 Tax=Haloquadratum walsbyi J07HQW2 TaxID=1238425 RepID=U1NBP4_9EURY|nr:hypothetical protein [Haloquadratum walsbyi]ERG94310.1 MAG: hypothetical protein J07HQW2_00744 [Haloquadratum walsbyi J07HQW2]
MCGGVAAYVRGDVQRLLDAAEEHGSLTAPEIAAILNERELPVEYEIHSSEKQLTIMLITQSLKLKK